AKSDWVDARLSARHARRARWNGEAGDSVRFANRADGFETPFQSEALSAGASNRVAGSIVPAYAGSQAASADEAAGILRLRSARNGRDRLPADIEVFDHARAVEHTDDDIGVLRAFAAVLSVGRFGRGGLGLLHIEAVEGQLQIDPSLAVRKAGFDPEIRPALGR